LAASHTSESACTPPGGSHWPVACVLRIARVGQPQSKLAAALAAWEKKQAQAMPTSQQLPSAGLEPSGGGTEGEGQDNLAGTGSRMGPGATDRAGAAAGTGHDTGTSSQSYLQAEKSQSHQVHTGKPLQSHTPQELAAGAQPAGVAASSGHTSESMSAADRASEALKEYLTGCPR
jgi:hypothetical protein